MGDTASAVAADATSNGLNATYVAGVQLGQSVRCRSIPTPPSRSTAALATCNYRRSQTLSPRVSAAKSGPIQPRSPTIERFFDLGNGANSDNIILYRIGTTNNLGFEVFQGGSGGSVVTAQNAISLNQWQYFAVSMDAQGNVTLYKNGVAIATGKTSVPRAGIVRTKNYIGKSNFGDALYAGALDEAAIYATPLSAAQFAAHYAQQFYGTASIDLISGGTVVKNLANGILDVGSFMATVPTDAPLGGGYQIRVTATGGGITGFGVSGQPFLITNSGHDYYVAVGGSDANSGKDPAQPMASVAALLTAYPNIGIGDTIHVGPGTYTLVKTMVLTASQSGVTISGPTSGARL